MGQLWAFWMTGFASLKLLGQPSNSGALLKNGVCGKSICWESRMQASGDDIREVSKEEVGGKVKADEAATRVENEEHGGFDVD